MKDSKTIDRCHICGKVSKLTFEHIPPQAAFNKDRELMYMGTELINMVNSPHFPWQIDRMKLRYTQKQQGIGWYTLCSDCNSMTGHWYADSMVDFIKQGYKNIEKYDYKNLKSGLSYGFSFEGVYPLRIAKEILAMFCSINNPEFTDLNPEIRSLLLGRDLTGIAENKFALYVYILRGEIARYIGTAGILNIKHPTNRIRIISELTAPPYGFVLEYDPKSGGSDDSNVIKMLNKYSYTDCTDIKLDIPVLESNTQYPMDYRTKSEIFLDRIKNRLEAKALKEKQACQ